MNETNALRQARALFDKVRALQFTETQAAYLHIVEAIALLRSGQESEASLRLEAEFHMLGIRFALRGNTALMPEHIQRFGEIALKIDDEELLLEYRLFTAQHAYNTLQRNEARDILLHVVEQTRERYPAIDSRASFLLGNIAIISAEYTEALPLLFRAEELLIQLPEYDSVQLCAICQAKGVLYMRLHDYANARAAYNRGLEIAEANGDIYFKGHLLANIGAIYAELKQHLDAIEWYERAVACYKVSGENIAIGRTLSNMGTQWMHREEYEKARECLEQSAEIIRSHGNREEIAVSNLHLAILYSTSGASVYNAEEAIRCFESAAMTAAELTSLDLLSHIHAKWSEFLERSGDFRRALEHIKLKHQLEQTIFSQENTRKIAELESRHQLKLEHQQHEITERLMEKFLPAEMIPRLKDNEKNIADHYDSVAVMFADIVGFTRLSQNITPESAIHLISFIFGHFDDIMQRNGCMRVKTIGDGYLAICGAPSRYEDHAERMARAALEILDDVDFPSELAGMLPQGTSLGIRVGLHIGALVCGIIGTGKYQFDVYGDTVNIASHMESHGVEDAVQITEDYVRHLESRGCKEFAFHPQGQIEIKGKGAMAVFLMEKTTT